MFNDIMTILVSIAIISAGLMAGVYFAFSGFIMRSFDRLGAGPAANAMNAINEVILRSWFMALFFGSSLLFLGLAVVAMLYPELDGRWWLLSAGLVYVLGMFVTTAMRNVPLNNRLAEAGTTDKDGRNVMWTHYVIHWTRWNHLRSVSSLLAMMLGLYYFAHYS